VEPDPRLAGALRDAAVAGAHGSPRPALLAGQRVLRFGVQAADADPNACVAVEVLLPDGRWLAFETLPGGELLLTDQPTDLADVRVRL
jgi:hypothetical protein